MAERPPSGDRRRPTLGDVAKLAGVAPMTASRAMNNERYVSEDAARKVREAARQLGYVAHQGARSLATNRADTVGLILPMAGEQFFNDPNIAPILAGASAELAERGSQLVVLIAGNDYQASKVREFVLARHVDGALIVSPEIVPDLVSDLLTAGVPVAATGSIAGRPGLDLVDVDTEAAIRRSHDHLVSRGARRIAMIAGRAGDPAANVQTKSFAVATGSDDRPVEHGDYSESSGREGMARLLCSHPDIDGVIVMSDVMARGAIDALKQSGRAVPDDVRVVGHDDSIAASAVTPALTTTRVPFAQIGAAMAELVLERVEDPDRPPQRLTVETELIERDSA